MQWMRYAVVVAPTTWRYTDGRDSGQRVGYLMCDAATLADLRARGARVMLMTNAETVARALVARAEHAVRADVGDQGEQVARDLDPEQEGP
jgi:hypothetical protein